VILNDVLQQDLMALLNGETTITDLLGTDENVREAYFQSKEIAYPQIRVSIMSNDPYNNRDQCEHSNLLFAIRCFAEDSSSGPCQVLAATVVRFMHKKFVTGTGWKGWARLSTLTGPATIREHLWRVEAMFNMNVYPTTAP